MVVKAGDKVVFVSELDADGHKAYWSDRQGLVLGKVYIAAISEHPDHVHIIHDGLNLYHPSCQFRLYNPIKRDIPWL